MASEAALSPEDRVLLERLAARVVELRLETPAILALESGRPLSLLASQTMLFFEPLAQALFRMPDYRRYATLVERRDVLEQLTRMIEDCADASRRARAEARRHPPTPSGPGTHGPQA
jgi:hypothetical protein